MAIEMMIGTAIKAIVGSTAGKLAGMAIEKGKAKIFPGELEKALSAGMNAAQALDLNSPINSLFFRCDDKQQQDCLSRVMEHSATLTELQKPIEQEGKIDQACLTAVFRQIAEELKLEIVESGLERWVKTFAETYFEKTSAAIRVQVAKDAYLKQLANAFDDFRLQGIKVQGQDIETPTKLVEIFIMPKLLKEESERAILREELDFLEDSRPIRLLREQRTAGFLPVERSSIEASELLKLNREKQVVVLGEPGSGKTTLMNFLTVCLAERQLERLSLPESTDWIPLLIRLRDWARMPEKSLLEYLEHFAKVDLHCDQLPPQFFEHWLDGRAVILLDGLDEITDEARRYKIVGMIDTFLGKYRQNAAVITSRPTGYKRDFFRTDEYPHYRIQPFDSEQQADFIDRWYDSRFKLPSERDRWKASLAKALSGNERIRGLARNPLLLTIIALIHRYQGGLPKKRHELYRDAVDVLLRHWDEGKEISNQQVLKYLDLDQLLELMTRLAYWIHCQGNGEDSQGGTLIDREELIAQICEFVQHKSKCDRRDAKREAERLLEGVIRDRAGLLAEFGQGQYAFVHKTFQEYLTAQEIREQQEEGFEVVQEHFERHLHDPHWREVLLLVFAQQKRSNPAKVLRLILERDDPYEKYLHRNLLFAASCLAEDVDVDDEVLVGKILDRLVGLVVSESKLITLKFRQAVSHTINCLIETQFAKLMLERLKKHSKGLLKLILLNYRNANGEEVSILELLNLLNDSDSYVRFYSVGVIGLIGATIKTPSEAVSALLILLEDKDCYVRSRVAEVLGQMGKALPEVVSALLNLLEDDNSFVRFKAAEALGQLSKNRPEIAINLVSLLNCSSSLARSEVARALGQMDEVPPEVVTVLVNLIENDDPFVRFEAARALFEMGNTSPQVESTLLNLLEDDNSHIRSEAAKALSRLKTSSIGVMTVALNLLKDETAFVRSNAVEALGRLGNPSLEVVTGLLNLLDDENSFVCSSAVEALGELGKQSIDKIQPLLIQWIEQHPESEGIGNAIDALWSIATK